MTNSNPQPGSRRHSSSNDVESFSLSDQPTDASNSAEPTPRDPFVSLRGAVTGSGPIEAPFEPAALIEVGQVVAERYEITQELGEGGMGLVFRANDRHMGRDVVLKFIRRELAADKRMVQRLMEESTAAARLQHPHIVAIFDRGRDVVGDFLVMEYVDGPNLWELLVSNGGKLPVEHALRYVRQVGSALQTAHEKDILHRDIKPSNVLIDRKHNIAKLADWGLARNLDSQSLTGSAAVVGTLDFMAPEVQRQASKASTRSDLYSLAAMLYQLVTGRSPKMMRESLIPEVLREPMLAALEDNPEHRPASVTEFLKSLPSTKEVREHLAKADEAAATGEEISAPTRPSSPIGPTNGTTDAASDLAAIFAQARARAAKLTEQAQAALAEYEYASAASLLEQIPEDVRDQALYSEAVTKRDRVIELDEAIREAVPQMQLDVLRPAVKELLQLQPHREDLEQLRRQIGKLLAAKREQQSQKQTRVSFKAEAPSMSKAESLPKLKEMEIRTDSESAGAPWFEEVNEPKPATNALNRDAAKLTSSVSAKVWRRVKVGLMWFAALSVGSTVIAVVVAVGKSAFNVRSQEENLARGMQNPRSAQLPSAPSSANAAPGNEVPRPSTSQQPTITIMSPYRDGIAAGQRWSFKLDDIEFAFRWCPPGKFTMGDSSGDSDEKPVEVTLSKGFWMLETEVTQELWTAVMVTWLQWNDFGNGPKHPVYNVSHIEATNFCEKLNGLLKHISEADGMSVSLPTEAQWEYACRAESMTRYYWGDFDDARIDDYVWHDGNSGGATHPVGQKKENAWGLKDMSGNVWEWCSDWYDGKLFGGTDPGGPANASGRIYRGGCWHSVAAYCRSAVRRGITPDYRNGYLGFRLVLGREIK